MSANFQDSSTTQTSLIRISETEPKYLQAFLSANDRGGYYMALYNMTGNPQCLEQAQIATFSEGLGGTAYFVNRVLRTRLSISGEYPGVYYLSHKVAESRDRSHSEPRQEGASMFTLTDSDFSISARSGTPTSLRQLKSHWPARSRQVGKKSKKSKKSRTF